MSDVFVRIEHMFESEIRECDGAKTALGIDVSGIDLAGLDALPSIGDGLVDPATLVGWLLANPAEELLTDYEVVEHAAAWERVRTFSAAQAITSMTEFARRPEYVGPHPEVGRPRRAPVGTAIRLYPNDELAARLGVTSRTIDSQLSVGLALAKRLPRTGGGFACGRLDIAKTRAIVDGCMALDADRAAQVEEAVLPHAVEQDVVKLRKRVRRAVIAVDPASAEERRVRSLADRRVWVTPADDGMAWLSALLPAADALTVERAVDAAARTAKADADQTDGRTLEQLRADMLVWPFTQALQNGVLAGPRDVALARHRGQLPQIQVTVAATTLLGMDEQPGELAGYGAIDAQTARGIAAEGTWRRLLTDPVSGTLLDVGTTTHRPPADMARHVEIRDQTCRYPTCIRPAERAELDHTVRYPEGPTAHDNLAVLCCRHHQLKHAFEQPGQPTLAQSRSGELRWTLPTGHTYVRGEDRRAS